MEIEKYSIIGNAAHKDENGNWCKWEDVQKLLEAYDDVEIQQLQFLQKKLKSVTEERDAYKKEMDERNMACMDALDKLWEIYGDKLPWEYAAQAFRIMNENIQAEFSKRDQVIIFANRLVDRVNRLLKDPNDISKLGHLRRRKNELVKALKPFEDFLNETNDPEKILGLKDEPHNA